MLNRLLNASAALQRSVALALLAAACGVAVWIGVGIADRVTAQRASLMAARERAGTLAAFARMDLSSAQPPGDAGDEGAGLLMSAPSVAIARANLQERISAIAQSNNAAIASAGNLPDLEEGNSSLIGLRVDFSGTNEDVSRTLLAIETGTPPLIVKELTVRSAGVDPPDQPPLLSVQLRVYAATRVLEGEAEAAKPQ